MLQLGARYYWPEIGRFVSQDPIGEGNNWYAYAGSNPVVRVDPEGLFFFLGGCAGPGKGPGGDGPGPGSGPKPRPRPRPKPKHPRKCDSSLKEASECCDIKYESCRDQVIARFGGTLGTAAGLEACRACKAACMAEVARTGDHSTPQHLARVFDVCLGATWY